MWLFWAGAAALGAIVVAAVILIIAGGGDDDGGNDVIAEATPVVIDGPAAIVDVVDNDFEPRVVQVAPGTMVTWRWEGSLPHNVTHDGDAFESDTKESGEYAFTFDEPGEYAYTCTVHTGMDGAVIVASAAAPSATP